MTGETDLFIENIDEILCRKNTGPIFKRIELETLANDFYADCFNEGNKNFLKFTCRYSLGIDILEQQINN